MAIVIYQGKEAKRLLEQRKIPLSHVVEPPDDIRTIQDQSPTARALFDYVDGHKKTVGLLFFECDERQVPWDQRRNMVLGAKFDDTDEFRGKPVPPMVLHNLSIPVYNMDARRPQELVVPDALIFYHELGHAAQWLENKIRYEGAAPDTAAFGLPDQYNDEIESEVLRLYESKICEEIDPPFPQRSNYPRWCSRRQRFMALNMKDEIQAKVAERMKRLGLTETVVG